MLTGDIQLLYDIKDKRFPKEGDDEEEFFMSCLNSNHLTKSQSFQDIWALHEFKKTERNPYYGGFYVDIGAYDGVEGSNTYLLQTMGWQGLCVEPNPDLYTNLTNFRGHHAIIDPRAVYNETGKKVPFIITLADQQLSTLEKFIHTDYNANNRISGNTKQILVETATLYDLLEKYRKPLGIDLYKCTTHNVPTTIDYLSLDTEGSEYDILEQFFKENQGNYTINTLTVEHNYNGSREKIYSLLTHHGYKRKFTEYSRWDDWYVLN